MNDKKHRRLIKTADAMAILGVVFLLLAHFTTNAVIWYFTTNEQIGATVQQVANAYESNPLAISFLTSTNGIVYMISYVFFPAIIMTCYYMVRKKHYYASPEIIAMLGCFLFTIGLLNFLNDAGNLVGVLLRNGLI